MMIFLRKQKKLLIILIAPLIFSLIPLIIQTKAASCAFVVLLMSTFWLTEALPIGVTSLIPVIAFPLLGILSSDKVTEGYFKDIVMLFFGGLVVANSIELTRLHERIALKVLMHCGSEPKWLLLGFMLTTAFLSLWISNTASTSMMLPVIYAVVKQLIKNDSQYHDNQNEIIQSKISLNTGIIMLGVSADDCKKLETQSTYKSSKEIESDKERDEYTNPKARNLITGFLLCSAYSATIGGLGSLVGTAPNVLIKGYFDKNYPNANLNFLTFLLFAFPISILMIFFSWIWLSFRWLPKSNWIPFMGKKVEENQGLKRVLKQKYDELGPSSWDQKCVGFIFLMLIILWITRDLHIIPGWGSLFRPKFTSDTTPAIIAVVLLFSCPRENIFKGLPYNHLINFNELQKVFPWSIVLLIGGGLVMANGFEVSGLSNWVGSQMKVLSFGSKQFILAFVIIISASATEFTSNVSIASIFIPLIDTLAKELNINPVYLLLPLTLSVSLAFMLPIATPNNAIIFSTGHLRIRDMISTGILMNFIGFIVIFIASNLWLERIFDLKAFEMHKNSTLSFLNHTNTSIFS